MKKMKYIYLALSSFILVNLSNTYIASAERLTHTGLKFANAFNNLSGFASKLTNGMLAFSMLSGVAVLLYHLVQLAMVGNNPPERAKVLKNLMVSAICIGLLGSIGLIMMFVVMYTGI